MIRAESAALRRNVARAAAGFAATVLACSFSACASQRALDQPAQTADQLTRAIYANDVDATAAKFEDALKPTVTRTDVGALSDKMHAIGDYKSLVPLTAAPDSGKYAYRATFTNGEMLVQFRIDPDGKVAAYRVVPEAAPTAAHA